MNSVLTKYKYSSTQAKEVLRFNEWMNQKDEYVILDTATTGLNPAEICEVVVLDLDGNCIFESLVKPKGEFTHEAIGIHGITDDIVADAPSWLDVWDKLYPLLEGKTLLIYNDSFDISAMHDSFYPYGLEYEDTRIQQLKSLKSECIMSAYADFAGYGSYIKLVVASDYETDNRALGNCMAALDVIKKVYDPDFSELDYERVVINEMYKEKERRIQWKIDEIKRLSEELQRFYQERNDLLETLLMSDEQLRAKLEEKEVQQEVAVSIDNPFNDDGKPCDLEDSDLPF
jgi:DNA polymerase-3 subunit epsilon